jgi:hypothetical protein
MASPELLCIDACQWRVEMFKEVLLSEKIVWDACLYLWVNDAVHRCWG